MEEKSRYENTKERQDEENLDYVLTHLVEKVEAKINSSNDLSRDILVHLLGDDEEEGLTEGIPDMTDGEIPENQECIRDKLIGIDDSLKIIIKRLEKLRNQI